MQLAEYSMKYNCVKIRYAQISRKVHIFPKEELNCKGEPCGEKILNGNISHDTFNEIASNNLDKKSLQERFITFRCKQDLTQRDSKSFWKGYIL